MVLQCHNSQTECGKQNPVVQLFIVPQGEIHI